MAMATNHRALLIQRKASVPVELSETVSIKQLHFSIDVSIPTIDIDT